MASWKKIIVSGSQAELAAVSASNLTNDNILVAGTGGVVENSGITYDGSALGLGSSVITSTGATSTLTGSFSGSFTGDGSGLTGVAIDIDGLTALGGATLAQGDDFIFSDGGTEKKVTFSNLEDSIFGNVSGQATIAAGGALSLGITAITGQTDMTGDVADTDELLINDGGALKRVDFSVFRDAVFNDVSGDATIAAGGALTIGSNAVEGSMLNSNTAGAGLTYANSSLEVDSGSLVAYYSSSVFSTVSGDIQITAGGVATIQADSVALGTDTTGNYVQSIANATNGGVTITEGSTEGGDATVALNIDNLTAAAVEVGSDSIAIHSSGDNGTRKESIVDLVAGIAGTNLSAASGQLSLSTTIANDHTFSDNLTIQGNLTVEGSQINAQVANLDVQDRFILLNSGSSTIGDSGIVFGAADGTANSGSAIIWDASYNSNDGRLAVVNSMGGTDTGDQTPDYHVAGVYEGTEAAAATAQADHAGNIRIEGGEIFIYV